MEDRLLGRYPMVQIEPKINQYPGIYGRFSRELILPGRFILCFINAHHFHSLSVEMISTS